MRPALARREHPLHRRAAGLLGQRAAADPQDADVGDGLAGDLAGSQLEVGHRRLAAEVQLRVLGRVEHGEGQRGHAVGLDSDEPHVDAEVAQLLQRRRSPNGSAPTLVYRAARRPRRAAAIATLVGLPPTAFENVSASLPARAELPAVEVDADPPDREQFELRHRRRYAVSLTSAASSLATSASSGSAASPCSSWLSCSSSAPPAISEVSCSSEVSDFR